MVHIYATNVTTLPDPKDNPKVLEKLSPKRREKVLKYINAKDRKLSLGAGLLLHEVLLKYNKELSEVQIGENGKPYIEGLHFNLSHSNEIAICAVGKNCVGCDIEMRKKAPLSVADRYFSEKEIAYLSNISEAYKDSEFYRLWTIKESYIKMTGEGLALPLNSFDVILENPIRIKRNGSNIICEIKEFDISGYNVSVCCEEDTIADSIKWLQLQQQ